MQQSQIALLPGSPRGRDEPHRTQQRRPRPLVGLIAGCSARHRKPAVFGWLVLVAVVFAAGRAMGTGSAPAYSASQAGQAHRTPHQFTGAASAAPSQSMLIQAKAPWQRFAADVAMWQPTRQIAGLAARGVRVADRDFTEQLHSTAPLVFAMVAEMAFVLLTVAFGSLTIPLVSAPRWLRRPAPTGSLKNRSEGNAS